MDQVITKNIKITNSNGESIQFGHHFKLYKEVNLSAVQAIVNQSESSNPGASYQGTKIDVRELDIPFFIDIPLNVIGTDWIEDKRQEAYKVFNPNKNPLRIDLETKGGKHYYLNAELVAAPLFPDEFEDSNYRWQKALLQFTCSDPFLYERDATMVEIATWIPNFEFELEIPDGEGIEMGYRSPSLIANVYNGGHEDSGMIIRFRANASLSTPSLINVNTYEEFKLNMSMLPGDVVEVSTYRGKKYARLTRNNVTSSVFGKVDLHSTFLQLKTGDNLFRYAAVDGQDNLEISMFFSNRFIGV